MKLTRRIACLLLAAGIAPLAAAQDYPNKPIRLISNYGAGSSIDIIARLVAKPLSEQLGQPVVVENKPGAGGDLGTDFVAKAPKDGYTIGFASPGPLVFNPMMRKSMPFAPGDVTPVILLATGPNVVLVNSDVPARTLSELIAYIKANPGKVSYASAGNGTSGHLAGELFRYLTKTDILHVPYKGNAEAVTDVLAGRVQVLFSGVPPIRAHVESGKLRAIAIADAKRAKQLPGVPTVAEAGLPGAESGAWYGILAPAGTPGPVLDRLQAELAKVVQRPEVRAQFDQLGIDASGLSRAEFEKMIAGEFARWKPLFASTKITAD
ncbi:MULTISPECIES: Bug family tripartite tricarboxylate transporter substrate binding protein [Ramlibacter]|uniref:Tripartite tricarboxylate transporter substrate binding protein n=1 Tax=Ramlibacter pinisoli TaxID=2682844 RepID=A0A6N8IQG6_9BURK|nr:MULTISPECIES: tripartite tricarboxylate transporter substrate binding protein [Ramlibacter]MBA2963829.1 tripartite tricarboxylate transporter substrate binding protein [Ramlibacter sp. CGMCC 1.13660]MVQ28795.1 tripartite tricarboxylate transporter substrate binding protein [Ramlibacter pinisoli]